MYAKLYVKKKSDYSESLWDVQESNLWPHACQACALNQLS